MATLRKTALGQATVEFALLFPLFMLCVLGLIEGGRFAFNIGMLQHALREGSRVAALPSTTSETTVKTAVVSAASRIGLTSAAVSVTANGGSYTSTRAKGTLIAVSAGYTYVPNDLFEPEHLQ